MTCATFVVHSQKLGLLKPSLLTKESINFKCYSDIDIVMTSDIEQQDRISLQVSNPIGFSQNYFLRSWIEASREVYENTLTANEQWFKTMWDLWLRSAGIEHTVIWRFSKVPSIQEPALKP